MGTNLFMGMLGAAWLSIMGVLLSLMGHGGITTAVHVAQLLGGK